VVGRRAGRHFEIDAFERTNLEWKQFAEFDPNSLGCLLLQEWYVKRYMALSPHEFRLNRSLGRLLACGQERKLPQYKVEVKEICDSSQSSLNI